jgi:hypothetical protein
MLCNKSLNHSKIKDAMKKIFYRYKEKPPVLFGLIVFDLLNQKIRLRLYAEKFRKQE